MKGIFNMSFNYPVSLNLANKVCLVIGGGNVALRKINTLLQAGGTVWVVSPQISKEINKLLDEKRIEWISKEINYEILKTCFLVIAATNNRSVNCQIADYCHKYNVLVNVVDSLEESSFIVNSFLKQGDLTIAISTNGKSPALAYKIKTDLLKFYGPEYALFLELLGEVREIAKASIKDVNKRNQFFREIVQSNILELIQEGKFGEAKERVKTCLLSY